MLDVINRLLTVEADLVVTVTSPHDRRRPGNEEDRIRLRNLVAEARARVLDRWSPRRARRLLEHLDQAAASAELLTGAHGVVLVATAEGGEAHRLPFPVREAVALASTPATRFLLQGLRRSPRYRVLVLSDRAARLFEGVRDEILEIRNAGFPMWADIVPRDRRAVAGPFARSRGRDDKERWRNFYRSVDRALSEINRDDPLPLVLMGVKRSTALFEAVSRNNEAVIARIGGAFEQASLHEIGTAVWPTLREFLRWRRRQAVHDLSAAMPSGRAVTGIDEVWQLGRQGRGHLLVVEETFRADPASEVDGRLVPAGTDRDAPIMDDPVDELIEEIVRAGGDVEFVANGALADAGRIGLILRGS